ncbi:MAG: class I SAM-dependent methyltransferase [Alphaproteobacteria bacterium]|nr:class I SAM-dependent methyltransferase [Alphaproteobacteria bacterium]
MKYRYRMLLATALSFFPVSSGFCMNQEDQDALHSTVSPTLNLRKFVESFVPADSSEEYIESVMNVLRDTINSPKTEIRQDHESLQLGVVQKDYGYNFPSIPRIQQKLLEFCAQADHEVRIGDVGPGFGYDSLLTLLTKNAKVTAFEKQEAQCEALKFTVIQSILTHVDPNFPVGKFSALHADFLKQQTIPFLRHTFDGINVNKVIHFFDPEESKIFKEKVSFFLRPGGRLFLTCLTPSPGTKIDEFMKSREEEFPGYLFYRLETELTKLLQCGESNLKEVRKPADGEESAHFFQTHKKVGGKDIVITDRVMHYHTSETLTRLLGEEFKILETCIIPPEENTGTDHMISIVAEKL